MHYWDILAGKDFAHLLTNLPIATKQECMLFIIVTVPRNRTHSTNMRKIFKNLLINWHECDYNNTSLWQPTSAILTSLTKHMSQYCASYNHSTHMINNNHSNSIRIFIHSTIQTRYTVCIYITIYTHVCTCIHNEYSVLMVTFL